MSERLFSYGTLQLESVQSASFGRLLEGTPDTMCGYRLVPLAIDDPDVVAVSGSAEHTMARWTGSADDRIDGTVFEVTSDELASADAYEVPAVARIELEMASGLRAWAYVEASSAAESR